MKKGILAIAVATVLMAFSTQSFSKSDSIESPQQATCNPLVQRCR
jgi:hypothetical protein